MDSDEPMIDRATLRVMGMVFAMLVKLAVLGVFLFFMVNIVSTMFQWLGAESIGNLLIAVILAACIVKALMNTVTRVMTKTVFVGLIKPPSSS